jgi:hypothetical protein
MVPVIIALVAFSVILFLISFGFKRSNLEAQLDEQNIRYAAEMFKVKKRLKALEEELLVEIDE